MRSKDGWDYGMNIRPDVVLQCLEVRYLKRRRDGSYQRSGL